MATDFLAGDGISIQLDCVRFVPTIVLRFQRYIEIKATKLPCIWAAFFVLFVVKGYVKRTVKDKNRESKMINGFILLGLIHEAWLTNSSSYNA